MGHLGKDIAWEGVGRARKDKRGGKEKWCFPVRMPATGGPRALRILCLDFGSPKGPLGLSTVGSTRGSPREPPVGSRGLLEDVFEVLERPRRDPRFGRPDPTVTRDPQGSTLTGKTDGSVVSVFLPTSALDLQKPWGFSMEWRRPEIPQRAETDGLDPGARKPFKIFWDLWTENRGAPKTRNPTTTDPTPPSRPSEFLNIEEK